LRITDKFGNISYPGAYQHSTEMEDTTGNEDDDAVSFVEVLELKEGDIISVFLSVVLLVQIESNQRNQGQFIFYN
jgi:hypothetical protein